MKLPSFPDFVRRTPRPNLTELALAHGTDKAKGHYYTQHYERHLQHLRDESFTLFEIGIGKDIGKLRKAGSSLWMWRDFFPKAQIVGLDIDDRSYLAGDRIKVYQGDQSDEALLKRIVAENGPIQVIIDDGSHRPEHIRESFRVLYPLLADEGGIYCIEDLQTSYWPEWGGSEDRLSPDTSMALVKDLVDGLNYEEYVDESYQPSYTDQHVIAVHSYHNLAIIEKGHNAEGTKRRRILKRRYSQ